MRSYIVYLMRSAKSDMNFKKTIPRHIYCWYKKQAFFQRLHFAAARLSINQICKSEKTKRRTNYVYYDECNPSVQWS